MSLVETIHDPDSTQSSVAAAYAQAIRDEGDVLHHGEQWARANTAIVERWDEATLQRIKTEAWVLVVLDK